MNETIDMDMMKLGLLIAGTALICATYLRLILLKAVPSGHAGRSLPAASTTHTFDRCRDFIEAHYTEVKSLQEIAERLNLRPPYLCRLFQQQGFVASEEIHRRQLTFELSAQICALNEHG